LDADKKPVLKNVVLRIGGLENLSPVSSEPSPINLPYIAPDDKVEKKP
jgi:hypothetical protein